MKKWSLIIGLLGIIFSSALPLMASAARGNCTWRMGDETYSTSLNPAGSYTSGCAWGEIGSQNATDCDANTKPASNNYLGGRKVAECCCKEQTAIVREAPKYKTPKLQINIPTLKLSDAACSVNPDESYQCEIPWLSQYIVAIYNYGLSIAGILAAIVLMAGGVLWLVSGGDASKVTQAKELITGSIIGLVILASSYIILTQINPDLVKFKSISLNTIKEQKMIWATSRSNNTAKDYADASCATDAELQKGIEFYATGYYKPEWEDSDDFFCDIAMQCSCPNGRDESKNCDQFFGSNFKNYHPCVPFPQETPYCNKTASGSLPQDGDIAGPNCPNLPFNAQVCFKGKTYTITDSGGAITGKRIDIWSGFGTEGLKKARAASGTGILTKGSCK